MNWRRLIAARRSEKSIVPICRGPPEEVDVRFGSKADICNAKRHVRFTPNSGHVQCARPCPLCANSGHSVTHSITSSARASTDGGTVEAQSFRGLEIDHQLVLVRRLHRQISWLLALEDTVNVTGRAAVLVDNISAIGNQAAAGDEKTSEVDRGQLVPGGQCDDQFAITYRGSARRNDQTAIRRAREGRDGALDFVGVACVDRGHPHSERRRHGLDDAELG